MEKMRSGELYCFAAPELQESFERAATLCARMRTMTVYDGNYRNDRRPDTRHTAHFCG